MAYRVSLSRRLFILTLLTTAVSVCACLASAVVLYRAPQVPFWSHYGGGDFTQYPALLLTVTALIASLSSILGCTGLSCDSKTTLMIYGFTVCFVAGAELATSGTVFGFAYSGELSDRTGSILKKEIINFSEHSTTSLHYRVNSLQNNYECCGVYSYRDWRKMNTTWATAEASTGELAPESCCKTQYTSVDNCTTNSAMLHQKGCLNVLVDRLDIAIDCVLCVCVLAAALNVFTSISMWYGSWQIHKYQHYSII